jgi:hypothetical protein
MTKTKSAEELAAPLGSVDSGRLVFARGAAHLTIGVDGSMEDLYRARFEGKVPNVRVDGGTVTVKYRLSFRATRGEITLSRRVRGRSKSAWGCPMSWPISKSWSSRAWRSPEAPPGSR